jgi:hypothetical protein
MENLIVGELKKGIVYVIKCNLTNKSYYGSTTQSLNSRKYHHINNNTTGSKDIIDGGDWTMKTLEEVFYKERSELLLKERWYIEEARKREDIENCLNKVLPYITRQEAKEQHEEIMRKWYIKNREKQIKTSMIYQEAHKEQHKEAMKRYQQSHREQIKLYQRSYRQKQFDEALRKINDLKLI